MVWEKMETSCNIFRYKWYTSCTFRNWYFTQVNSITDAINNSFGIDPRITGVVLAVFVALVVFGGLKSISNVATKIVPLWQLYML